MTINEIKNMLERKISYLGSSLTAAGVIGDLERAEALEIELQDTIDALAQLNTL